MAGKKYYAVKKGRVQGIFGTWAECKESIEGYSGAEYQGFAKRRDAELYLGIKPETMSSEKLSKADLADSMEACLDGMQEGILEALPENASKALPKTGSDDLPEVGSDDLPEAGSVDLPEAGTLLAYVDGSYDHKLKKYAFGCVFILPDGRIYTEYGNGDNEQSLQHRNVTGEMLGAMYAVKCAIINEFSRIEIRYDYEGIEKWVTGEWRSRTELTQKYAQAMRGWGKDIAINFTKVAAHSNVYYNELADKTAKAGLREGNGVPKVRRLEEMRRLEV